MSKCLVVPRFTLEVLPFWKRFERVNGIINDALLLQNNELSLLMGAIERDKEFLERSGEDDVEHRPEWQQIILYALVLQNDKLFLYKRGGKESSYKEKRLYSKISAGVGGHIEPFDSDLITSLHREIGEELVFLLNGKEVSLPGKIEVIGAIKEDLDSVSQVHFGLACVVRLNNSKVEIKVRGSENVECWMTKLSDYPRLENSGQYDIEGWTKLLMKMFLAQQKTA